MSKQRGGTPAIVELQQAGVAFEVLEYDHDPTVRNFGLEAANALGLDPMQVFKTLLVVADGRPAVGIVPVDGKLSLKGIASALGAKKAEMMVPADAERLTGYVVGGISPFGQKRRSPTVLDEMAELFDVIYVSGGRRGLDLAVAPGALVGVLGAIVGPIAQ